MLEIKYKQNDVDKNCKNIGGFPITRTGYELDNF